MGHLLLPLLSLLCLYVQAEAVEKDDNPIYLTFFHVYPKPLLLNLTKAEEDLLRNSSPAKAKTSNLLNLAVLAKKKHPKIFEKVMEYKIKRQERKDAENSRPEAVKAFIDDRTIFELTFSKAAFPADLRKAIHAFQSLKDAEKKLLLEYYPNLKVVTESAHFKKLASKESKTSDVQKLIAEFMSYKVENKIIVRKS